MTGALRKKLRSFGILRDELAMETLGESVICETCGATLSTISTSCSAPHSKRRDDCPGEAAVLKAMEDATAKLRAAL